MSFTPAFSRGASPPRCCMTISCGTDIVIPTGFSGGLGLSFSPGFSRGASPPRWNMTPFQGLSNVEARIGFTPALTIHTGCWARGQKPEAAVWLFPCSLRLEAGGFFPAVQLITHTSCSPEARSQKRLFGCSLEACSLKLEADVQLITPSSSSFSSTPALLFAQTSHPSVPYT